MLPRNFLTNSFVTICLTAFLGVSAQAAALMPKSDWLVKPQDASGKICTLESEYENGYIFSITQQVQGYQSLKINFRQDVFSVGKSYPMMMGIGPNFNASMAGKAVEENTLEFALNNSLDFAKAIESSSVMTVVVGDAALDFSLNAYGDTRSKLDACFNGGMSNPLKVAAVMNSSPNPVVHASKAASVKSARKVVRSMPDQSLLKPVDFTAIFDDSDAMARQSQWIAAPSQPDVYDDGRHRHIAKSEPAAGHVDRSTVSFGRDIPLAIAMTEIVPEGYRYRFSEGVDAGRMVSWDGDSNWEQALRNAASSVGYDVRMVGKTVVLSAGRNTVMKESLPAPVVHYRAPESVQMRKDYVTHSDSWKASQGDDLQSVLSSWSNVAGVDFVWSTSDNYKLPRNVSYTGTFEEAVRQLLSQFGKMGQSPVGVMHTGTVL